MFQLVHCNSVKLLWGYFSVHSVAEHFMFKPPCTPLDSEFPAYGLRAAGTHPELTNEFLFDLCTFFPSALALQIEK